jgi:predicted nucleic acid-binding protein
MATKVLFFDTSALIKLFVKESGSEIVSWLKSNVIPYNLHLVINDQVCNEFINKIKMLSKKGELSKKKATEIEREFTTFYKGQVFRVIGQNIISNTKQEQTLKNIIDELGFKEGRDDWDALHYQSIVNALAYLGGQSHPILVTADSSFAKKVALKGYRIINPIKQSVEEIKKTLVN